MQTDIDYDSETYNAYATVEEVDASVVYYAAEFGSDFGWSGLVESEELTQKQDLIIVASRSLAGVAFKGTKNSNIQAAAYRMQFPRSGLYYPNGGAVPEILPGETDPRAPYEIRDYVALYCMGKMYERTTNVDSGLKSKTVDDITEVYGVAQRDFNIEKMNPMQAIPAGWLYQQEVLGFGGVGSIGGQRYL